MPLICTLKMIKMANFIFHHNKKKTTMILLFNGRDANTLNLKFELIKEDPVTDVVKAFLLERKNVPHHKGVFWKRMPE